MPITGNNSAQQAQVTTQTDQSSAASEATVQGSISGWSPGQSLNDVFDFNDEAPAVEDTVAAPSQLTQAQPVANTAFRTQAAPATTTATTVATNTASPAQTKTAEPSHSSKPSFRQAAAASAVATPGEAPRAETGTQTNEAAMPAAPAGLTLRSKTPLAASEKPAKAAEEQTRTSKPKGQTLPADAPVELESDIYDDVQSETKFGKFRKRGSKQRKYAEREVKAEVANRAQFGGSENINTKLTSTEDPSVGLNEVSMGSNIILETLRQPNPVLLTRANNAFMQRSMRVFKQEDFIDDNASENLAIFCDQINDIDLWVTFTKPPSTDPQSYQARILRTHYGDGCRVHPLAVKAFNGDFDGDDATTHLNSEYAKQARSAVMYLIGIDGECLVDWDYFPRPPLDSKMAADVLANWFEENDIRVSIVQVTDAWMDFIADNDGVKFIRKIAQICGDRGKVIGDVLGTMYNAMYDIARFNIDEKINQTLLEEQDFMELTDMTEAERTQWRYQAEARAGRLPSNWHQYMVDTANYLGEQEGKNIQYRQGTISKAINRNPDIYIGSENPFASLKDTTLGLISQAAAGRTFTETWQRKSEVLSIEVISKVGFPGDYPSMTEFFTAFKKAYNTKVAAMYGAEFEFDTRFSVLKTGKDRTIEGNTNADFVDAFLDVYGNMSMRRVFADMPAVRLNASRGAIQRNTGTEEYRASGQQDFSSTYTHGALWLECSHAEQTVREFAFNNRVHTVADSRNKQISDDVQLFIYALADTRTSTAGKYDGIAARAFTALEEICSRFQSASNKLTHQNELNYERIAQRYVDVIYGTHPDMFSYFGLDNIAGFMTTGWGKRMLSGAYNQEALRMAMLYEWRTARLREITSKLDTKMDQEGYARLASQIESEMAVLASSSDLWNMVVTMDDADFRSYCHRIRGGGSHLQRLGADGRPLGAAAAGLQFPSYYSIDDLMKDFTLSPNTKKAIIRDLIIENGGWIWTRVQDIAYQMELNPASNYSGVNIAGWEETRGLSLKQGIDELEKEAAKKNWDFNYDNIPWTESEFEVLLEELSKKPWTLNAVSVDMWADAAVAAGDKDYWDTEKASQQDAVEKYYLAAVMSKNGGTTQEIALADNYAFNMVGFDQISRMDIVKLFTDPDFEIHVYDNYGQDIVLSQEALKITTFDAKWAFLNAYPSLANCFSRTISYIHNDQVVHVKGNYKRGSFEEALGLFADNPGFIALANLFTEANDVNTPFRADQITKTARKLIDMFATIDLAQDFVLFPELDNIEPGLSAQVTAYVRKYAARYQEVYGRADGAMEIPNFEWSKASVQAFADSKQTLNGAKTSTSTGIEGYMTTQHGVIQLWANDVKDAYIEVDSGTDEEIQQQLVGQPTSEGIPYEPGMKCIVYAPDMEFMDETLDTSSEQLTSVARFFDVKRMKSGEDHNTKVKKSGDDGTDSIAKMGRYDMPIEDWRTFWSKCTDDWWKLVGDGTDKSLADMAIEKIRYAFALRLKAIDTELKYGAMSKAQYMNIARLMVSVGTNRDMNGEFFVPQYRSLEQVSARLNAVIGQEIGDLASIKDEVEASGVRDWFRIRCQEECDKTGTESRAFLDDILNCVRKSVVSGKTLEGGIKGAKRKRSSSYGRNIELIEQIINDNNLEPLSPKQCQEITKKMTEIEEFQWNYEGCNLLGVVGKGGINLNAMPGNHNYILVDKDAVADEIAKAVNFCYKFGMTMIFDSSDTAIRCMESVPDLLGYVVKNVGRTDFYGIPFFDMKQNGFSNSKSATWVANPDCVTLVCEDAHPRFKYGDAVAIGTQAFFGRVHNEQASGLHGARVASDPVRAMFANTIEATDGMRRSYSIATVEDLELISTGDANIDMRVEHVNNKAEAIYQKYDLMIREFFYNWDGVSPILEQGQPDRCIGFAKCHVSDPLKQQPDFDVYAPIVPFMEHKAASRSVPAEFLANHVAFNPDTSAVEVHWQNNADTDGRWLKFFEGYCPANKETMVWQPVEDHRLPDGTCIDVFLAAATTAGRREGSNRRRDTMLTMMHMTFKNDRWRFNIAQDQEFANEQFREALLHGRVPLETWKRVEQFYADPVLDNFVKDMVAKAERIGINPSDFFANKYRREDGTFLRANNYYEFELMLSVDYEWQNNYLKLMNKLNPAFCPAGLDDASENHLFRCCQESGPNAYCMQMQVPWKSGAKSGYTWENVYASWAFFGDDTSLTKRAGLSAADVEFQSLQMTLHGGKGTDLDFIKALRYATAATAPANVRHILEHKVEVSSTYEKGANEKVIDSFRGKYYFLSNFYPCTIVLDGVTYSSAEAAFQAQKDPSRKEEFAKMSAAEAKAAGRKVKMDVYEWNEGRRDEAMRRVLKAKFDQNIGLAADLAATGGAKLVEGNQHGDRYWGTVNGVGANMLGTMLMEIRDQLVV